MPEIAAGAGSIVVLDQMDWFEMESKGSQK